MARDYKKIYAKYQSSKADIKRRSCRNKARRIAEGRGSS